MNPFLVTGVVLVFLALILYSAGMFLQARIVRATDSVMRLMGFGVAADAAATLFMILGSRNVPLTLHGIMGYSALLLMAVDTLLIWRLCHGIGRGALIPAPLRLFSAAAYGWWLIVFIAGAVMTSGSIP